MNEKQRKEEMYSESGQDSLKNQVFSEQPASAATPEAGTQQETTTASQEQKGPEMISPTAEEQIAAKEANTKSYADLIGQKWDAYGQAKSAQIDEQVRQNQEILRDSYENNLSGYQKQFQNYTTGMYQGMDNQALMSRVNGQYGGMATAQVGAVQNAYQAQRQQLAQKQQQIAVDTARQMEQLRAQGEFDKADALLSSTQQRLQELYADAIRVDENRYGNQQYDTTIEREDQEIQRNQEATDKAYLQALGQTFLSVGAMPSDSMLEAMGLTKATAQLYINAVKLGR